MRRREFIAGLGGAAAWPGAAAGDARGWLSRRRLGDASFLAPFLQGLPEAGFIEGQNVMNIAGPTDSKIGCRVGRPIRSIVGCR
jgi:hypothetical protein